MKLLPGPYALPVCADAYDALNATPPGVARLIVTSPPYNIGKPYEPIRSLKAYLKEQERVITACVRVLSRNGSLCWQVGNYVTPKEIMPLDLLLWPIFHGLQLKLKNRIIWHFEHGLHCRHRFSGRYETILWFSKSDRPYFNLDAVRVPQKYPNKKHFKGPKRGELSGNPLGKNPGDVWLIPNVKHNHVEKTIHPCQFPVELVERLVLSMTEPGDLVIDPYMGTGTTLVAAFKHGRHSMGSDIQQQYVDIAKARIKAARAGTLRTRPMHRDIYSETR